MAPEIAKDGEDVSASAMVGPIFLGVAQSPHCSLKRPCRSMGPVVRLALMPADESTIDPE